MAAGNLSGVFTNSKDIQYTNELVLYNRLFYPYPWSFLLLYNTRIINHIDVIRVSFWGKTTFKRLFVSLLSIILI